MTKVGAGVGVFVIRDDGSFLMGKRKGAHGEETWSVPGGWIEFGESWSDTAIREVAEETGLVINKPIDHFATTNNFFPEEDIHSITIWLKTAYNGGEPQIREPDKFVEQDWFTLETLPSPLFKPWQALLKQDIDILV